MLKVIVYLILSYLCGAIPFGYIVGKIFKHTDIRTVGSGNTGATNVYRTSKTLGILTLFLDMLKGFIPVYFVTLINPTSHLTVIAVALVTILGHIFTVFLNFKGGKGVATACGVFLAINPLAVLICFLAFAIILAVFKYVSLASITAALMLPVSLYIFNSAPEIVIFASLISVLVIVRHFSNIKRLLNGTENKIFGTKK
ncbi:MAG: glycerol-3-phosphate 1-O-acyltransferase PlsY [Elusimicrobia bacterium]|jgi:glycerol-3-phosphate acyltransferase PlsY|nr:glycerol-3-phosphate 1-O-acyltransferase PlsY [Elusimicrobiota bacterium]MBR4632187.1 glycerol-3-phosphate 1-O-acyltransferase PlsY [Elusimicrobiota bacterium]